MQSPKSRFSNILDYAILTAYSTTLIIQYNQPPMERFPNWDSYWGDVVMVANFASLKYALLHFALPGINTLVNFGWNAGGDLVDADSYINPLNWLAVLFEPVTAIQLRNVALFSIAAIGCYLYLKSLVRGRILPVLGGMYYLTLPLFYTLAFGGAWKGFAFSTPWLLYAIHSLKDRSDANGLTRFALISFLSIGVGNVNNFVALPCVIGSYSFFLFVLDGTCSPSSALLRSAKLLAVFLLVGAFYEIPIFYNIIDRGAALNEIVDLGYHVAQRGYAMIAYAGPSTAVTPQNSISYIFGFIASSFWSILIPVSAELALYIPFFSLVAVAAFCVLPRSVAGENRQVVTTILLTGALLIAETFVYYALPEAITKNSPGRVRAQIELVSCLLALASIVSIDGLAAIAKASSSSAKRTIVFAALATCCIFVFELWEFIGRHNPTNTLDFGPWQIRHQVLSPFPSSNLVSLRWAHDMWPFLPFSNLALLSLLISVALFLRKIDGNYLLGVLVMPAALLFLFHVSLLNELRMQEGDWGWAIRNNYRMKGHQSRLTCLKRYINFSDPQFRTIVAGRPIFGATGNKQSQSGRNWKLIAETELGRGLVGNVLWPYLNVVHPFSAIVFSSITDPGGIQLNNFMPPTTEQAVTHLSIARSIGARWLISADVPVDPGQSGEGLEFRGVCESPMKGGLNPAEFEGGKLYVYELSHPTGVAFLSPQIVAERRSDILRKMIAGKWSQTVALVDSNATPLTEDISNSPGRVGSAGEARVVSGTLNHATVEVHAVRSALMTITLLDRFFWSAKINGQPTPIVRVYGGFMGVVVPSGKSTIVFTYRPWDVYLGLFVSLCTLLSIIVIGRKRPDAASYVLGPESILRRSNFASD